MEYQAPAAKDGIELGQRVNKKEKKELNLILLLY